MIIRIGPLAYEFLCTEWATRETVCVNLPLTSDERFILRDMVFGSNPHSIADISPSSSSVVPIPTTATTAPPTPPTPSITTPVPTVKAHPVTAVIRTPLGDISQTYQAQHQAEVMAGPSRAPKRVHVEDDTENDPPQAPSPTDIDVDRAKLKGKKRVGISVLGSIEKSLDFFWIRIAQLLFSTANCSHLLLVHGGIELMHPSGQHPSISSNSTAIISSSAPRWTPFGYCCIYDCSEI